MVPTRKYLLFFRYFFSVYQLHEYTSAITRNIPYSVHTHVTIHLTPFPRVVSRLLHKGYILRTQLYETTWRSAEELTYFRAWRRKQVLWHRSGRGSGASRRRRSQRGPSASSRAVGEPRRPVGILVPPIAPAEMLSRP